MEEQVLWLEGGVVNDKGNTVNKVSYYVSINNGKIYRQYKNARILYQIKNNQIVQEYDMYEYLV